MRELQLEYGGGGYVTKFENRPLSYPGERDMERKFAPASEQIAGYATRYHKVHYGKDGFEAFSAGCFATTLLQGHAVRFLVGHDEGKCIATTETGLDLHSDEDGLAFRCPVANSLVGIAAHALASSGCAGMSVGYRVKRDEIVDYGGHSVRMIREAELVEITITEPGKGAVREAFAVLVKSGAGSLANARDEIFREESAVKFRRAMNQLKTAV